MSHSPSINRQALEKIAAIFRSLSEPTRLAILRELKDKEKTVNELVEAIGTSQPNISKQLRLLYDAGLLGRKEQGIYVRYHLEGDLVLRLCDLVCDRLNQQARAAVPHYSV
jgi:DNA-binding transcriptional ArsR family regulator